MGTAGHGNTEALRNFDQAIRNEELNWAWIHAHEITHLGLDRALKLTVLMAKEDSPGYEKAARKWLGRFIREYRPSLELVEMIVGALKNAPRKMAAGVHASDELLELADRIDKVGDVKDWRPRERF